MSGTGLKQILKTGCLSGALLLTGCFAVTKTPTEQAMIHFTLGEYEQAIDFSQEALKENPKDAYALMIAGISYDNLGYPNKSRRFYEDIMETQGVETGAFAQLQKLPPQDLKTTAAQRLTMLEHQNKPYAKVDPETGVAVFENVVMPDSSLNVTVSGTVSPKKTETFSVKNEPAKGGLDMLSEKDRNIVQRFLTFIRLRDEKLVTENEWQMRRAINLGGLLPYSLTPAGLGMDLPSPPATDIVNRLDSLRSALELRSISPREHAVEREVILNALLPAQPRHFMAPEPPPEGILDGAKLLRRLETLQRLGLITAKEAEQEKKVLEKLIYTRLGMDGGKEDAVNMAPCIQKCLKEQACPCASKTPVKKTVSKSKKKKAVTKPKTASIKKTQTACVCPVKE